MRRSFLFLLFVAVLIPSVYSTLAHAAPSPSRMSSQSQTTEFNYANLLERLELYGFNYDEADTIPVEDSFLSVECKLVFIRGELISVYQYSSNESMERDSKYIHEGGCSIQHPEKAIEISWVSYPHFFKNGVIIVNYVGENEDILKLLREILGEPFAGYAYINR